METTHKADTNNVDSVYLHDQRRQAQINCSSSLTTAKISLVLAKWLVRFLELFYEFEKGKEKRRRKQHINYRKLRSTHIAGFKRWYE